MTAENPNVGSAKSKAVTVIALCFNHARFLHECLNSIAAQSEQNFQLIVTDDCSRDDSASLIEAWLNSHRPDAIFIRHTENAGLCKTLNEALSHARGEFIGMIATDDVWEPDKLERQLAMMRLQSAKVAVVYSDAARIDEVGQPIEKNFIEAHSPGCKRPSGQIFAELADRNFIPAMATLIRRQALVEVGGYDERLTYEDYDMWLRMSVEYDFVYCPAVVARYRIVANSIVRTTFVNPSARHHHTLYLICSKWLPSKRLTSTQREAWIERLWGAAYGLYCLGDSRAKACLRRAARYSHKPRVLLLAITCSLGISRSMLKRLIGSTH